MNTANKIDVESRERRQITQLAKDHYENFPVASFLLPAKLREPIRTIYAFARCADDIADEGDASTDERLQALELMRLNLVDIDRKRIVGANCNNQSWLWSAIEQLLHNSGVPVAYMLDLLSAFEQDVNKKTYIDEAEVADYTRRSADPIGRMILHLAGYHRQPWLAASDKICSALQLINFYQDIAKDILQRGRLYLPLKTLRDLHIESPLQQVNGVAADRIDWLSLNPALYQLTRQAMDRLESGRIELKSIGGRLGLELNLIGLSGYRIANKLLERQDPLRAPRLNGFDRLALFVQVLFR